MMFNIFTNLVKQKDTELEFLKKELEEKNKQLDLLKNKTYEEVEKNGHIYVLKTDGGIKVGKTKNTVIKRIKNLQTGNKNKIEILLDYETSNEDILEKLVHYILSKYRHHSNREFFDCDVEYIKIVIETIGNTMDILKSSYENISNKELYEKLNYNCYIIEETVNSKKRKRIN